MTNDQTPSITRYLNVQMAYAPNFFADGKRIAYLSNTTGVPQVWQVGLREPGGDLRWPDQLTFETDRVQGVYCSPVPGDDRLIYVRDRGGDEKAQLYLLDTGSGAETCLTAGYDDVMHIPGPWSPDGALILFTATRRNPGLFDAYIQPLDGEARLLWQNDQRGFLVFLDLAPDQSRAIMALVASSFDMHLYEIELATGNVRQLTPGAETVRYTSAAYGLDGRTLYVVTDRDSDNMNLLRLDLATLAWETVVAPGWDLDRLKIAPDRQSLAYVVNVEGATELHLLDLVTGATRTAPPIDSAAGMVYTQNDPIMDFAPDSSQIVFTYTSDTRTLDNFIWDIPTDTVYPVTRSAHGGLNPNTFIAAELIHYPTFDTDASGSTRHIPAWFYRPPQSSDRGAPVIVVAHGGPESQSRPMFLFYIQYFLQKGYAVLRPNVRGSTGYGKAYTHLDDVTKRMDSVADLAHAAYWLKQQPGIDGERLIVYGGSYGGFMVLAALTTYPDLWCAGVDIVGISNFVSFLENTSAYRRAHREAEYGSLEHDRAFLESVSPINHVDQIVAPLMVIHGANDPRVPLGEAEQIVAALEAREVPVRFLVFDDEGHGIVKLQNKQVAYPAIGAFLDDFVQ